MSTEQFFNHKNFFRIIWNVTFSKNVFIYRYSYMTNNFKFRISLLIYFLKSIICLALHQHASCDSLYLLCQVIYQYTQFLILKSYICKICFLKSSLTTDLCSLCAEYISISLSCNHDFIDLL